MVRGAKILIEEGSNGLQRHGADKTYTASEVTMHLQADHLAYQRSFGEREEARLFGTGKLDTDLCAFGHPDESTRQLQLTIRGSAEETLRRWQNAQGLGRAEEQRIANFKSEMRRLALSYFPPIDHGDATATWFLEVVITKQEFESLLESYRARRLSGLLLRIVGVLLVDDSAGSRAYLPWDNTRQQIKRPELSLKLFSWLEAELPLGEWPFG